jgi:parallel beta-helix repeat protein
MKRSWIRNLFARPVTRPIRKVRHGARLAVEALEDRTVPSRFPGAGLLDGADSSGRSASTGAFPSTAHVFLAPHSVAAPLQLDGGGGSPPVSIPYNGGSLLTHVQVQGVYYNDPTTLGFQSQMDGFFTNIVQSPWVTQMLANFSVGNQTIGAGSFLGDDNTGLTFLSDGMIQSQLSSELAKGRLAAPNGNTLYAVFVPPGSLGGFALGYHDAFIDPSSGKVIYYMVIDSESFFDPNFTELQGRTDVTSHELSEAITDPGVGLRTPAHPGGDTGWLSPTFDEIGDVSEGADLVTYHGYVMQEEWGRSPTDPPNLALGPVVAPADTDFAVTQVKTNPTEGSNNGVFATFTDKDGASESPSQFTVTVDWGDFTSSRSDDGSGDVTVTSNGDGTFNVIGRHNYSGEAGTTYGGHFPGRNIGITGASVFVSSGDEIALTTTPITLQEAGPLTNVSAHSFGFATGQALTNQVVGTFTDPGGTAGADPDTSEYQASINWGDGTPTDTHVTILPNGHGHYLVLGNSHTYTSASGSPYQVSVTITHDGTTNVVVGQATATLPTLFIVTSLLDDGSVGTLRWAVAQADAAAGLPTITFDPSLFNTPQTIMLSGAPLELSNTIATETITGPAAGVTVTGAGLSRVFLVDAGVSASLSGLTITGGKTAATGGGLDNEGGIVMLSNCTISGNSAGGNGGGLDNNLGLAALTNCTISGNSATDNGGGVYSNGIETLTSCTISGNSATGFYRGGAGLENFGTATLTNCTVSGNSATGLYATGGGLANYGTATLTDCTVSTNAARFGGGLYSASTLALTNCSVSGNSASYGGGLSDYGTAALTNCSVSGNTANLGGGLRNLDGTATLANCTVSGNSARVSGGGLVNSRGSLTLTNCGVSDNSAGNRGGGLYTYLGGTTTLTGCTVSGNSAFRGAGLATFIFSTTSLTNCTVSNNAASGWGGGLWNRDGSTTALTNCTVSGNSASSAGGGLYNFAASAMLANCTVSGNSARQFGGGLDNSGTATLTNCTVSGNSAIDGGGGLRNRGTATLTNCTVSGNSGGGLRASSRATLNNTIVAGNTSLSSGRALDITGSVTGNNNLIGTGGSDGLVNGVNGNIVGVANALLAPLGSYGGPTQTMALLPGSPAIDAGTSTGAPALDQRGQGRVGAVDIGAFESQGFNFTAVPSGTPQSANIGMAFANPLAISVTSNKPIEPVDGGIVQFVALPVNGASAIMASSAVITGGVGGVTAAPNNFLGSYTVVASVGTFSATYHLTNTGTPFAALQVNVTSDLLAPGPGLLSLREAIGFANTDPSGVAQITFDPSVFAATRTITLTTRQLELTHGNDTITGPANGVIVSGNHANRVLQVDAGVTASISGMTLAGGKTSGYGGGLLNNGTVTLANCTVSDNSARIGGGLYNNGTATLTNSKVSGNTSQFSSGGLYNNRTLALTNCTVSGNSAQRSGGGLDSNAYGSTLALTGCTVSGNFGHYGGGVYSNGTLALTNCTVSGNAASVNGGGVYVNRGTGTLTNCTVSGNTAGNYGGGLNFYYGSATLTNCTVSGNTAANGGGGLYAFNNYYSVFGALTLTNTIVAGNTNTSAAASDITGSAAGTNNLIGTGGSGGLVNGAGGNLVGVANALLAPLGNYGGPTQTMPLLPGSPAIDAGTSTGAPAFDQRGQGRVGAVDIGAFESQGFTIAVTSGSGQSTNISTAFAAPLVVTVTANNPSEPVAGGRVTFTPPSSGASATIGGSPATISAAGTASVTATANGFAGSYTVSATARGITTPAGLSLSNRPTITVPAAQTAYQNVDQPISGISIGDAASATLTVTLNVSHGTLTLGTTAGLTTVSGNGSGSVTLIGTTANLNAALASLIYRGSHNYSGGDVLSLTATDSGVSATPASVALTVVSITQQATALQAQVSALQSAGVLNQGQANSLIVKLNLQGNDGDVGKVQAFLNEVAADLNASILTQAQADALLGLGNILLLSVTRR